MNQLSQCSKCSVAAAAEGVRSVSKGLRVEANAKASAQTDRQTHQKRKKKTERNETRVGGMISRMILANNSTICGPIDYMMKGARDAINYRF